jgi:trimethylamine---corrinoid protein Co-methyltransferase
MRARTTWLSDAEKSLVYDEALVLLERVGLKMAGSQRLAQLRDAGAAVDEQSGVVRFPAELVDRLRRQSPREIVMAGAAPENDVVLREGEESRFAPSGCAALTLDHRTGKRRPSTLEDLRNATMLLDETPELDVQWTTVTANDVPLERREKLEYYTVLTETDKHVTFVDCPSAIEPVLEIVEVLCGSLDAFRRRPRISTLFTVASPLSLDGGLLDFHARLADYGTPIEIYTVPISGATAPVTLAGVVVQGVAELLGAVAAMQILSPGARLICGPSGAVLDMRSTSICYGAVEGGLLNAAFTEVLHHLGLPVITPGLGTDAKHLGVQDGFEKALKAIVTVAAGSDLLSGGMGLIDSVNTLYLPQIVVDAEIVGMIRRLLGDVEFTQETMARETIERVGIGGNFLREKETRRRIRAGEHFIPRVASRLPYEAWQAQGTTEIDVAVDRVEEILALRAERAPHLADDQLAALRKICDVDGARVDVGY